MGKKRKHSNGHYCRICGCCKSNERFSGKGHRSHVCKTCQQLPKARRQEILDAGFIWSVMEQGNISTGNLETLQRIAADYGGELGARGAALVEKAKARPRKKKRIEWLHKNRRPLFVELVRLGLVQDRENDDSGVHSGIIGDALRELELRCLEIDTELRFHAELLDAYETDVPGGAFS